jgi:hypothetical protein
MNVNDWLDVALKIVILAFIAGMLFLCGLFWVVVLTIPPVT